jgi:hypothetical protein
MRDVNPAFYICFRIYSNRKRGTSRSTDGVWVCSEEATWGRGSDNAMEA